MQTHHEPRPLPSPDRLRELLHDTARVGRDDVIPALLQAGAEIEARDAKGFTPLILANHNGRHATALLLGLGAGDDPAISDIAGSSAASVAAAQTNAAMTDRMAPATRDAEELTDTSTSRVQS